MDINKLIKEKEKRIRILKHLLRASDYKALKYAEGELSAAEYEDTRKQRASWRTEINILEEELQQYGRE